MDLRRAEESLNALIERRALEAEAANRESTAWAESVERYDLRRAAELRRDWCDYYRTQIAAAEQMRERAVARLGRLIDGGGGS